MTGPRSRVRLVRRELGVADGLEDEADHPDQRPRATTRGHATSPATAATWTGSETNQIAAPCRRIHTAHRRAAAAWSRAARRTAGPRRGRASRREDVPRQPEPPDPDQSDEQPPSPRSAVAEEGRDQCDRRQRQPPGDVDHRHPAGPAGGVRGQRHGDHADDGRRRRHDEEVRHHACTAETSCGSWRAARISRPREGELLDVEVARGEPGTGVLRGRSATSAGTSRRSRASSTRSRAASERLVPLPQRLGVVRRRRTVRERSRSDVCVAGDGVDASAEGRKPPGKMYLLIQVKVPRVASIRSCGIVIACRPTVPPGASRGRASRSTSASTRDRPPRSSRPTRSRRSCPRPSR